MFDWKKKNCFDSQYIFMSKNERNIDDDAVFYVGASLPCFSTILDVVVVRGLLLKLFVVLEARRQNLCERADY